MSNYIELEVPVVSTDQGKNDPHGKRNGILYIVNGTMEVKN